MFVAQSATPSSVVANQKAPVFISTTVSLGSDTHAITNVTVNLSSIGGSAIQKLVWDGSGDYTNNATVGLGVTPGVKTLLFTATDAINVAVQTNTQLTVNPAITTTSTPPPWWPARP